MKSKLLLRLLILFTLFISIFSCEKDADYLKKYTGSFAFTVTIHQTIYIENIDTTYSSTFNGQITIDDEKLRRLSINYGNGLAITPKVLESGQFVDEGGYSSNRLSGQFSSQDEVIFDISGDSAGFSIVTHVTGKRN
ncbi:MAG TPA: hypothetical protein VFE71_04840 [Bacteroidales bacterium]|nr:hypothetical protein [Bacteroidales bacterium]